MNQQIKTAIWVLLVASAYVVGTQYPPRHQPADREPSRPGSKRGLSELRRPAGEDGEPESARAEIAWVNSLQGRDGRISAERMEKAVWAVLRETDPVKATLNFTLLVGELSAENAPAMLEVLRWDGGAGFLSLLAHAWGEMDGAAAMLAFGDLRGREASAKSTALAAWASVDHDAAIAWWEMRDQGETRAIARGLLTGLARRDVDGALEFLLGLDERQQMDYIGVLVDQKLKEGVRASADWALELPGEGMRTNALETVGMKFLREDLDAALEWASSIADRPDAHEAVADVAKAMANRNPQEAAAWVAQLPGGPSQDHAFEDVFENWTAADPLAASESLRQMEPGHPRDAAIQAFSRTLARENPQDALEWAGVMGDPALRGRVQVEIARRWRSRDRAEADAWITTNLSPEIQELAASPQGK